MDYFEIGVESSEVLRESHLIAELQNDSSTMDDFPVLIDGRVNTFTEVDGGYDRKEDVHIIQLILDKPTSIEQPNSIDSTNYELHLTDYCWSLYVEDTFEYEDEEKYVLVLYVTDYDSYPYSFEEELDEEIDNRPTRSEFDE